MVSKNKRQADFDKGNNEESTESSEDLNRSDNKACSHVKNSIKFAKIKRELKKTSFAKDCLGCSKTNNGNESSPEQEQQSPIEMWICLQCGSQNCGDSKKNHALEHSRNTNRSDSHCIAFNAKDSKIHCYDCDMDIPNDISKGMLEVVTYIQKLRTMPITLFPAPKISTPVISTQVKNGNNEEEAPPSTKQQKAPSSDLPKVVGLMNLGNTCFFNSVLQCLAHTPYIIKVLEDLQVTGKTFVLPGGEITLSDNVVEKLPPVEGTLDSPDNFASVLHKTLTAMQNATGYHVHNPRELLNALKKRSMQCMDGDQHDAHELLRHLLEIVRDEDLKRYQGIILDHLGLRKACAKDVEPDKMAVLKFYGNQASSRWLGLDPIFRGILVSTLECWTCHHTSPCVETFLDLSLPVTADKPHPPVLKKKNSYSEESSIPSGGNAAPSKHQLKKEKRAAKKSKKVNRQNNNNKYRRASSADANDDSLPNSNSIAEENADSPSNNMSLSADESDADVEDNVEAEGDGKTEVVESGYSSEKVSTVTTPISPIHNETFSHALAIPPLNSLSPDDSVLLNSEEQGEKLAVESNTSSALSDDFIIVSAADVEKPFVTIDSACNEIENSVSKEEDNGSKSSPSDCSPPVDNPIEESQLNEKKDEDKKDAPRIGANSPDNENDVAAVTTGMSKLQTNNSSQSPARYALEEGECSIQSCLNQFTALEFLNNSNKVRCDQCTIRENKGKPDSEKKVICTPSTKQYLISRVPAVLILHLKRFQATFQGHRVCLQKIKKQVNFPLTFDLSPICKNRKRPKIYSLYGVVMHHPRDGTRLSGGHYVACVKTRVPLSPDDPRTRFSTTKPGKDYSKYSSDSETDEEELSPEDVAKAVPPPGRWYQISDSSTTEIDEKKVLESQAYLLFYERIL